MDFLFFFVITLPIFIIFYIAVTDQTRLTFPLLIISGILVSFLFFNGGYTDIFTEINNNALETTDPHIPSETHKSLTINSSPTYNYTDTNTKYNFNDYDNLDMNLETI